MELIDASKYSWVDSGILETSSTLDKPTIVREANIEVCSSSNWLVVPVETSKRICSNFEECSIPFYECLFTQINL